MLIKLNIFILTLAQCSSSSNEEEEDDVYLINKLNSIEINDSTYSEVLRLYFVRCLNQLKQRRAKYTFQLDVTQSLHERLSLFTSSLETKSFDLLLPALKANIMAFICDELLSTSSYDDRDNQAEESANQDECGIIVKDLDQTLEELNEIKHEKWQLESKTRSIKMEKLNASVQLNNMAQQIARFKEAKEGEPVAIDEKELANLEKEREKQQKLVQQVEKKLAQIDKKRVQLKKTFDKCTNKLRSGNHLGQDRFMRHYWALNCAGGVFVEASAQAGPGSVYFSSDSVTLLPEQSDEMVIGELLGEMVERVEEADRLG